MWHMAQRKTGVVKLRGRWVARVTWTRSDLCRCAHFSGEHAADELRPCLRCACAKFAGKRKDWRQVADPNREDIAKQLLAEKLRELAREEGEGQAAAKVDAVSPASITFAQLAERYKALHVRPPEYEHGQKIRGMKDHAGVRSIIDKILVPALGGRLVVSLTRPDLEELRNARLDAPKLRGGRKIVETKGKRSIARVNREMATLGAILNYGIDLGVIARNPMRGGRGRSLVNLSAERPRDRVLSPEEEARLLKAFREPAIARSREYFIVALDTGMREAEMFGLTVDAVDFAAKVIRLPWEITKTKRPRIVAMSRRVADVLRARCAKRGATERVFGDVSPTVVRKDFHAAKTAAKVQDFRMHDCRATIATRLLQSGLSEAEIAMMTGHRFQRRDGAGSAPVLRKHYLRLTPQTIKRAATAMDGEDVN
jgi:integrase